MKYLKRSIFWLAIYILAIFMLGGLDYLDRPIINFSSYFYLVVMIAIPVTLFFPYISNVKFYIPLFVWAGVYLVILQILDRGPSTIKIDYAVIVLEFVFLEGGVWLCYQLSKQISNAESLMDVLALSAFPNRALDIDLEYKRIKNEFARCRRYNRPLSLIVIESESKTDLENKELLNSIQQDFSQHFRNARVAQLIDNQLRQTDLIMKGNKGYYIILCPETDLAGASHLTLRIEQIIGERTDFQVKSGISSFPAEALTFEELLQLAQERMIKQISKFPELKPFGGDNEKKTD